MLERGIAALRPSRLHLVIPLVVLMVYGAVLVAQGPRGFEKFPFFKWELFSKMPLRVHDAYTIRFVEAHGEQLAKPVDFADSVGISNFPKSPTAYQLLQQLGRAHEAGRFVAEDTARRTIEDQFLRGAGPARYQLVRLRFDVLERARCHCTISETVLATYEIG
jgi:hypothetical protein